MSISARVNLFLSFHNCRDWPFCGDAQATCRLHIVLSFYFSVVHRIYLFIYFLRIKIWLMLGPLYYEYKTSYVSYFYVFCITMIENTSKKSKTFNKVSPIMKFPTAHRNTKHTTSKSIVLLKLGQFQHWKLWFPCFVVVFFFSLERKYQSTISNTLTRIWKQPITVGLNRAFRGLKQITHIWAASWQNQQCDFAPSEDSDQPGHPPSLIRVFAVRWMGS